MISLEPTIWSWCWASGIDLLRRAPWNALQGTTAAAFTITGLSGTLASFVGTITFTTNRAALGAEVARTLDLATGAFSATSSSFLGTGKLEGATGGLVFAGVENLLTGAFTEVVTGQARVDLAP